MPPEVVNALLEAGIVGTVAIVAIVAIVRIVKGKGDV
jgi:O-antigen ligase